MPRLRLSFKADNLKKIVDDAIKETPETLGDEMQEALESAASTWPVKSGYSKANFGYTVIGDKVQVTNEAYYAPFVEKSTKRAIKTIRKARKKIVASLDQLLQEKV